MKQRMSSEFIYQLFALLLCLLIVSRLALRLHPPNVSISRHLPRFATDGQAFDYSLTVTNLGQRVETDGRCSGFCRNN